MTEQASTEHKPMCGERLVSNLKRDILFQP
jgi:hypothetical protein